MSIEVRKETVGSPERREGRAERIAQLIGNTPMVRLNRIGRDGGAPIYVKLENMNPSGSIRDRYLREILDRALMADQLRPGDTLVLAGIDDSAVSAAFVAHLAGLDTRIHAPKVSSRRLVPLLRQFGAKIVWEETSDLRSTVMRAAAWAREHPNALYVDGFRRQAVRTSYGSMAREIVLALAEVPLGAFITSVTTGGAFREVSRELRAAQPLLEVAGVRLVENEFATDEPLEHVQSMSLRDVWEWRDRIARREGLLLSPKGAACVKIAVDFQERLDPRHAIVALNPDDGQRYLGWERAELFKAHL